VLPVGNTLHYIKHSTAKKQQGELGGGDSQYRRSLHLLPDEQGNTKTKPTLLIMASVVGELGPSREEGEKLIEVDNLSGRGTS